MKRVTINALIDIGCVITFILSLITGLVLYFVLPSGGGRGNSYAVYLGITRSQWLTMHDYTSLVFASLLIIHILLHGKFFWNIRKNRYQVREIQIGGVNATFHPSFQTNKRFLLVPLKNRCDKHYWRRPNCNNKSPVFDYK
jgi:hypothetical protein